MKLRKLESDSKTKKFVRYLKKRHPAYIIQDKISDKQLTSTHQNPTNLTPTRANRGTEVELEEETVVAVKTAQTLGFKGGVPSAEVAATEPEEGHLRRGQAEPEQADQTQDA